MVRNCLLCFAITTSICYVAIAGPPANDECAAANQVACDSSIVTDNSLATTAADDPIFDCQKAVTPSAGAGSVWFSFAPTDSSLTISTCNSSAMDSMIQVLDGTCGNFTAIACNDDLPCGGSTFLSGLTLTGLTIGQTYYLELAAWDSGSVGSYEIELDCSIRGACCIGQDICTDNLDAGDCFDAGGLWLGLESICVDAISSGYCVAPIVCPPGTLLDSDGASCGQPAPDHNNAGCASPTSAFQSLGPGDGCGMTICGNSSADDRNQSNRDTDWFLFEPVETMEYTACVTAQFFPQVQFWLLNPGIDPCLGVSPVADMTGNPGETVCQTLCVLGGNPYAIRVTTVDANGDPQRAGVGCMNYLLEISCDVCVIGACCLPDASCQVDTTEIDCIAAGGDYLGDNSDCANVICTGSCCEADGACTDGSTRVDCHARGGNFNGLGSTCADAFCRTCSYEDPMDLDGNSGPLEDCRILIVDIINSGCTLGAPGDMFSTINCGDRMCAATNFDGGTRDLDWYHLQIDDESDVLFELNSRLDLGSLMIFRLQFRDIQMGLPACGSGFNIIGPELGDGLPPGSTFFEVNLPPARYTVLAAYDFESTGLPFVCPVAPGYNYELNITCNPGCIATVCGDSNCDGVVSVSDIAYFVAAVVNGEAGWSVLFPNSFPPCDYVCANDTSGDGNVGVADIGPFVNAILSGSCP